MILFLSNLIILPNTSIQNDFHIADTCCSGNYTRINSSQNTIATNPISLLLPNGGSMILTQIQSLNILSLTPKACTQHLFTAIKTSCLLSIDQLYDHGCTASFSKYKLYIKNKQHETIIVGRPNPITGNKMWMVNICNDTPTS